jgi:peptidyl-prolyl cis-trans isomerase A (cyclophilin A)
MKKLRLTAACAALCAALAGCSASKPRNQAKKAPELPAAPPAVFRAVLETSKGRIVIETHRDWAPHGVDQFYTLLRTGFFDDARFFRVVQDYVAQFGINGDPEISRLWTSAVIPDDPVKQSNVRGAVTFAASGPNTRTTQLFINLHDNKSLDKSGFAPIGMVVEGMDAADRLYFLYGDTQPRGDGPNPRRIEKEGNEYLKFVFSRMDFIKKATIEIQ